MKLLSILIFAIILAGCNTTPYARIQYEYQLNETKLKDLCRGGVCNESSPHVIRAEAGIKLRVKHIVYRGGICHSSKLDHGWPINDKAEYYSDGPCFSAEFEF